MTYAKGRSLGAAGIVVFCLGLLSLAGCTKGGSNTAGAAVTVEVTSDAGTPAALTPGAAATITATVYDQSNQGVTWSISPLNFGALSAQTSTNTPSEYQTVASITYTAPTNFSTNTTVTITATSISNPNITTSLPIKVTPIAISLQILSPNTGELTPAAAQTLAPGSDSVLTLQALLLNVVGTGPTVNWTLSPSGAGTLVPLGPGLENYIPPNTVSSPLTVTVTATASTNAAVTANVQITVLDAAGPNVAAINVDGGPVPNQIYPNTAFTSITVCNPGSTTSCQIVDGVLVDTGSNGLRILQSKIPLLKLPTQVDNVGNILQNCDSLVDGSYLWGPVSTADIYITGEIASSVPIQVISSSNAAVPDGCSNGGSTNENTPQLLGANGILGVGLEPTDCSLAGVNLCNGSTTTTVPNLYYSCPSAGCTTTDTPVSVSAAQQVSNPVPSLTNIATGSRDDNGVIVQFPEVSGVESAVSGLLIFGIGTEQNNQLGNATVFTLDSNDNFTTVFNGQTLTSSFIDSGSNALFFPDSLPVCRAETRFFCPASLTNLSAENKGTTQGQSTVDFSVDNADSLFSTYPADAAFATLAGPNGTFQSCSAGKGSCVFAWGLPFFYGQSVYTHIDACIPLPTPPATCDQSTVPYWAY